MTFIPVYVSELLQAWVEILFQAFGFIQILLQALGYSKYSKLLDDTCLLLRVINIAF